RKGQLVAMDQWQGLSLLQFKSYRGHGVAACPEVFAREGFLFPASNAIAIALFPSRTRSSRRLDASAESQYTYARGLAFDTLPQSGIPSGLARAWKIGPS